MEGTCMYSTAHVHVHRIEELFTSRIGAYLIGGLKTLLHFIVLLILLSQLLLKALEALQNSLHSDLLLL